MKVTEPLEVVVPLMVVVPPLGGVIVTDTLAPEIGEPPADTCTVMLAMNPGA